MTAPAVTAPAPAAAATPVADDAAGRARMLARGALALLVLCLLSAALAALTARADRPPALR